MRRPIVLGIAMTALACGESPPADGSNPTPPDSVAAIVADTGLADSVMARDTARQLPER